MHLNLALCLNAPLPGAAADDPWGPVFHLEMTRLCHGTWLCVGDKDLFSPERSEGCWLGSRVVRRNLSQLHGLVAGDSSLSTAGEPWGSSMQHLLHLRHHPHCTDGKTGVLRGETGCLFLASVLLKCNSVNMPIKSLARLLDLNSQ